MNSFTCPSVPNSRAAAANCQPPHHPLPSKLSLTPWLASRQGRRSLVALTPTEYRLLRFLMVNAGRVVSKGQILDQVWEYDPARDRRAF